MHTTTILIIALTIVACTSSRSTRTTPTWAEHLKGWQKVFGLIAFVGALLILINPEFLALGLLGDTAFFDVLVLALSLQMHLFFTRAFHSSVEAVSRGVRCLGIPSPGLRYVLAVVTPVLAGALSAFQKALHRLVS